MTTISHPWLSILTWILLAISCMGSFMAFGPPGAPIAKNMNSSAYLIPLIDSLGTQNSSINSPVNDHFSPNHTDPIHNVRYSNISFEGSVFADPFVTQDSGRAQLDYWFFNDPKYKHLQPLADSKGYPAFRDVTDPKYGAKGNGVVDDWAAIMKAVTDGGRCGANCTATSKHGAIIYFPPGTYVISKPIVQYYFSVFVGHPLQRPTIKGSPKFEGIALIDTDVYIDGGWGATYWTNQNNFYREIRNFVLDITQMPNTIPKAAEGLGPVGIHWQVSQACTLQNIHFRMPRAGPGGKVEHVGIYMENGSGGFVSDLTFVGGKIGFIAGNQQYTARDLHFIYTETAIQMVWDWGFTWKNIKVEQCKIGINASQHAVDKTTNREQSTGSLTVLDSRFKDVEKVIIVAKYARYQASVVLDNIQLQESIGTAVSDGSGETILAGGAQTIESWGVGRRYIQEDQTGSVWVGEFGASAPRKDSSLLAGDKFFERSKPQYIRTPASDFLSVLDFNVKNDGTSASENTIGINKALRQAADQNKILVFPAGIYQVNDTLFIPSGSRIVGYLWSQIMAVGPGFEDDVDLRVLAKVGNPGDKGVVEISDMMFTGKGATAGAIFMEWNIKQSEQGSAAMWNVIFRVGGAAGTDLDEKRCHKFGNQLVYNCQASSMMLHVTETASIYMENMWFWVADHDIESKTQEQINIYGGRGVLIESQGPSWVHSASNEHSTLYNWQLANAKNIYLGHIQSETPYFQAGQLDSLEPYDPYVQFAHDPEFPDCGNVNNTTLDTCREAWALRIIKSQNVYLYGGGFYSFFNDYTDSCAQPGKDNWCQDKLIDIDRSENIWIFNLFTVGTKEIISAQGLNAVPNEPAQNGFATAISAWLTLANQGKDIGGTRKESISEDDDNFTESGLDTSAVSPPCDWSRSFADLDAIKAEGDKLTSYCAMVYSLEVLSKMLSESLSKYDKERKDYEGKFNDYKKLYRSMMNDELDKFMSWYRSGPGLKYFTCIEYEQHKLRSKHKCPIEGLEPEAGHETTDIEYIWDDEDGFFKELGEKTMIQRDWVKKDNYTHTTSYNVEDAESRPRNGNSASLPVLKATHKWTNAPRMKGDFPVPDPKDVVDNIRDGANALQSRIQSAIYEVKGGIWRGPVGDLLEVLSVPVFMLEEGISGMQEVRKLGDEVAAEEKKQKILTILGLVFLLVPIAGEYGATFMGFAGLAKIIGAIAVGLNAGLTMYEAVSNPEDAPMAIMGFILGSLPLGGVGGAAKGAKAESNVAGLAKRRREWLSLGKSLGPKYKARNDVLEGIIHACVRRG